MPTRISRKKRRRRASPTTRVRKKCKRKYGGDRKSGKEKTAQAAELAPKLQKFALDQKLAEKAAARERELASFGKAETTTTNKVANLRASAQNGEKIASARG